MKLFILVLDDIAAKDVLPMHYLMKLEFVEKAIISLK